MQSAIIIIIIIIIIIMLILYEMCHIKKYTLQLISL